MEAAAVWLETHRALLSLPLFALALLQVFRARRSLSTQSILIRNADAWSIPGRVLGDLAWVLLALAEIAAGVWLVVGRDGGADYAKLHALALPWIRTASGVLLVLLASWFVRKPIGCLARLGEMSESQITEFRRQGGWVGMGVQLAVVLVLATLGASMLSGSQELTDGIGRWFGALRPGFLYAIGVLLVSVGLWWIGVGLRGLSSGDRITFTRHWGGLGSGETGWELVGQSAGNILRLVCAAAIVAVGSGMILVGADDDKAGSSAGTGTSTSSSETSSDSTDDEDE